MSQLSQPSAALFFSDIIVWKRGGGEEEAVGCGVNGITSLNLWKESAIDGSSLHISLPSQWDFLGGKDQFYHIQFPTSFFFSAGELTHIWFTVLALHVLWVSGVIWFLHRQLASVVIYLVCSHQLYVIWFNYRKTFIIIGMETMDYVLHFKVITQ